MDIAVCLGRLREQIAVADIDLELAGANPVEKLSRVFDQALTSANVMHDDRVGDFDAHGQAPEVERQHRLLEERAVERQRAMKIDDTKRLLEAFGACSVVDD